MGGDVVVVVGGSRGHWILRWEVGMEELCLRR